MIRDGDHHVRVKPPASRDRGQDPSSRATCSRFKIQDSRFKIQDSRFKSTCESRVSRSEGIPDENAPMCRLHSIRVRIRGRVRVKPTLHMPRLGLSSPLVNESLVTASR